MGDGAELAVFCAANFLCRGSGHWRLVVGDVEVEYRDLAVKEQSQSQDQTLKKSHGDDRSALCHKEMERRDFRKNH
jgi:hypothetical protein